MGVCALCTFYVKHKVRGAHYLVDMKVQKVHLAAHMDSPAAKVINIFGGIRQTAEVVGRHRSVVNRWLIPKSRGGTGGIIPAHHQQTLLKEARRRGLMCDPSVFFMDAA
jgi:hypothetical protein